MVSVHGNLLRPEDNPKGVKRARESERGRERERKFHESRDITHSFFSSFVEFNKFLLKYLEKMELWVAF